MTLRAAATGPQPDRAPGRRESHHERPIPRAGRAVGIARRAPSSRCRHRPVLVARACPSEEGRTWPCTAACTWAIPTIAARPASREEEPRSKWWSGCRSTSGQTAREGDGWSLGMNVRQTFKSSGLSLGAGFRVAPLASGGTTHWQTVFHIPIGWEPYPLPARLFGYLAWGRRLVPTEGGGLTDRWEFFVPAHPASGLPEAHGRFPLHLSEETHQTTDRAGLGGTCVPCPSDPMPTSDFTRAWPGGWGWVPAMYGFCLSRGPNYRSISCLLATSTGRDQPPRIQLANRAARRHPS